MHAVHPINVIIPSSLDLELIPDGGSLNAAVIKRILNYKEYTDKLADYSGWSIQEFIATD